MGIPSAEKPQGTLEAVCPLILMGKVKGKYPQKRFTSLPPMTVGRWPMGKAGTAIVGVSRRS
jgi:hypothetical protein